MPDLEERVAALEELVLHPPHFVFPPVPPLTEAQEAELREAIGEAAAHGPYTRRILPSVPPLTPEQVRYLLSECVTVVKPGEVMILRALEGWTPQQVLEVQQVAAMWLEDNAPGVKALVMPPFEIAIVPGGAAEPEFMSEVQADACWSTRGTLDVRLTHEPSGVIVEAATRTEAVAKLGRALEGYARRHAGGVPGAA